FPVPQHVATIGAREARDAAQERRLPAAVGAAERDPFARRDIEGDLAKKRRRPARAGEAARREALAHGITLSRTIFNPVAPGFTTALVPTRSPDCGVAFPEREMRASTRTAFAPEI